MCNDALKGPYSAGSNHENHPHVNGPGDRLGYYAETLYPHLVCKTEEEAQRAAAIANIAYSVGYAKAQRDMRDALGIES